MRPRSPEEPPVPVDNAGDHPPRLAPGKGVAAGTGHAAKTELRARRLIPESGCPDVR